jgi:hypothetical protein
MTKSLSLFLVLTFFLSSCSWYKSVEKPPRFPANAGVVQTQSEILEVFEFRSSNQVTGMDCKKSIIDYVQNNVLFRGTYSTGNEIALEFVEDGTLPKGIAYFPQFSVSNNIYKIIINHSKESLHDPVASAELLNFLRTLKTPNYFLSHFAAFEMYYNALEQDPLAAQSWAKIREIAANLEPDGDFLEDEIREALKARGAAWAKEKEDYAKAAELALKTAKKKDAERRAVIDALDSASDDMQFKNLVAKNDRKGAADLLKKYLPWEQMAPFEQRYWETYLEAMANPLPMDQRIFIYRGVNDDFIYSAYKNGKEIPKEIAQKEGDIFIMSTLLTKNQGTWNRRLRSLSAMYEKFIATNYQLESEFTKSARIITMFFNHSKDPKGSPFLSLTPKFHVAHNFGSKKMTAYALDPRLVSFNFASTFKNEVEFLLPLMAFPEDVVGFYDAKIHTDGQNSEEFMKKLFIEKLTKNHGEEKANEIFLKVMSNSKEYFDSALNRYDGKITAAVSPVKETNFLVKFFNKMFNKKPTPPAAAEEPKNGAACLDIITSFWK